MGAFGQLESVWPVHGTVLVLDDTAYFAAGRSSQLDGGIRLYGVDATTGQPRCHTRLEGPHYDVDQIEQNYQLPMGALPDILLGGEGLIHMRHLTFDTELRQRDAKRRAATTHVSAKGGLLDSSYFKRSPWTFGGNDSYARLIVHDDRTVYSVRMFDTLRGLDPSVYFTPGKQGYLLFATDRRTGQQTWAGRIGVRVNAMVATDGLLFVAGPPDVVDPDDPLAAFEGRKGGALAAIDSATGQIVWQGKLSTCSVFHGMAAASGRLLVSLQDGRVVCLQ
jgi:outer membrane protein assembly factor BamB